MPILKTYRYRRQWLQFRHFMTAANIVAERRRHIAAIERMTQRLRLIERDLRQIDSAELSEIAL